MDEAIVRPVYPRRSLPSKRRKRINKEKSGVLIALKRQFILAVIVLFMAGAVKGIDSPITKYLTEKLKFSLVQEVEFGSTFNKISGLIDDLKSGLYERNKKDINNTVPESIGVSENTGVLIDNYDDEGKIDYSSIVEDTGKQAEDGGNETETLEKDTKNIAATSKPDETDSLIVPVSGLLSSPFGERIHPIKGTEKFHNGIDIEANSGVPIKAALDGEVIEASKEASFGNFVEIKHQNSYITIYAHCSVLLVKRGQKVKKGDVIAKVGSTGDSTGPHLHFEVWKNANPIDPLSLINVPEK